MAPPSQQPVQRSSRLRNACWPSAVRQARPARATAAASSPPLQLRPNRRTSQVADRPKERRSRRYSNHLVAARYRGSPGDGQERGTPEYRRQRGQPGEDHARTRQSPRARSGSAAKWRSADSRGHGPQMLRATTSRQRQFALLSVRARRGRPANAASHREGPPERLFPLPRTGSHPRRRYGEGHYLRATKAKGYCSSTARERKSARTLSGLASWTGIKGSSGLGLPVSGPYKVKMRGAPKAVCTFADLRRQK